LNICGGRFAPSFLKMERVPKIFNIQSFEDNENIPIQFFCHKMHKKNLGPKGGESDLCLI